MRLYCTTGALMWSGLGLSIISDYVVFKRFNAMLFLNIILTFSAMSMLFENNAPIRQNRYEMCSCKAGMPLALALRYLPCLIIGMLLMFEKTGISGERDLNAISSGSCVIIACFLGLMGWHFPETPPIESETHQASSEKKENT